MQRRLERWLAAAIGLLTCATASADQVIATDWSRLSAHIDGAASALMQQHHTVSGVVAVEHAGETVLLRGYGWQNIEAGKRVDPAVTLFRQASISKLFTWVSVMQLAEQGKLDLDEDVNRYLRTVRIADTYPGRPVTLRHCMTHTAGFEESFLGFLHPTTLAGALPPADAMRRYQPRRVNAPGEAPAYSNYCAALAGLVVSDVAGVEFVDYVQRHVIDAIGMHSATFRQPLPVAAQQNAAVAYSWAEGRYHARSDYMAPGYLPTGGLLASAPDMLRFGRALLNGGVLDGSRILNTHSVRTMFAQQFTVDERLRGIGLGFLHFARGEATAVGHNGNSTNFSTHFGMLPEQDLVIYVAFGGPGYREVQAAVTRALYREILLDGTHSPTSTPAFVQPLQRFAGTYGSRRSNSSTLEKLLKLRSQVEVAATRDGALMIGGKRYESIGNGLFRGVEERDLVAFQLDAAKRARGYAFDGAPYLSMYRMPFFETARFNTLLLSCCALVAALVVLSCALRRDRLRAAPEADRAAYRAALLWSLVTLCTILFGMHALSITVQTLFSAIPLVLKLALVMAMLSTAAAAHMLYHVAVVWRRRLLGTRAARWRYSVVGASAAAIVWFYSYWNILGFRYT